MKLSAVAFLWGIAACSTPEKQFNDDDESDGNSTIGTSGGYVDAINVVTAEGTALAGPPLRIRALHGRTPSVEILVSATAAGVDDWQASGGATEEDLAAGRLVLDVKNLPIVPGVANVLRLGGAADLPATSGQLSIQLDDEHQAIGRAVTELDAVSADFNGSYTFECWVTPEELGQPANGEGGPDDQMFVQDFDMASVYCQGLTRWR